MTLLLIGCWLMGARCLWQRHRIKALEALILAQVVLRKRAEQKAGTAVVAKDIRGQVIAAYPKGTPVLVEAVYRCDSFEYEMGLN